MASTLRHLIEVIYRKVAIAAALLTITVIVPIVPSAQTGALAEPGTVRVGFEEFRPYSFTGEDGVVQGYSIDLIRTLIAPHGHEIEFVRFNNPGEMLEALQADIIDMTTLLAITPERQRLGTYTDPIGSFQISLFALNDTKWERPEDLAGRRIGAIAGSFAVNGAKTIPFAEIVEFPGQDNLLVALLGGSVDAVSSATETFQAELRRLAIEDQARLLTQPLLDFPRGFVVQTDQPELLAQLNASIEADLQPTDLKLLDAHWFGQDRTFYDDPNFVLYLMLGAAVAIALITAVVVAFTERWRANISFAENANNRLLVDALNAVDVAIIIFDKDMKPLHWNDALFRAFHKMVPNLRRGDTLPQLIAASYVNGTTEHRMSAEDAAAFAGDLVATIKSGGDVTRTVEMSDGRSFEATEFSLSNGMYALVRKDVSRVEEQAAQIRAQSKELEAVNARLRDFSSLAAHDLRSPLRQQKMLLEMIEEDIAEPDTIDAGNVNENIGAAKTTLDRLNQLIEDLLEYARVGSNAPDEEDVDPAKVLPEVLSMIALPSGFEVMVENDLPMVRAQRTAFETVVRNLLSNAVKHHDRDHGIIQLRAKQNGDFVIFEIEDDGPGIAPEFRERIFKPFHRLRSAEEVPGSGLGLSFIQRTVESWGGSVSVSCPEGRGSIFSFSVPKSADASPPSEAEAMNVIPLTRS